MLIESTQDIEKDMRRTRNFESIDDPLQRSYIKNIERRYRLDEPMFVLGGNWSCFYDSEVGIAIQTVWSREDAWIYDVDRSIIRRAGDIRIGRKLTTRHGGMPSFWLSPSELSEPSISYYVPDRKSVV